MNIYLNLFLMSMVPVIVSVVFYILNKKTKFNNLSEKNKQIIFGIIFGLCACFSTEFGVDINGATANVRDASVLCAGLLFGGPAGLIAGFIGGIERYFATFWGAGEFTQVACSISTILSGFYAFLLRKYVFENRRPSVIFSFVTGIIMEIIHMTIVFLTNITNPLMAYNVVKICTIPMTICNGFSVMLSTFLIMVIKYRNAKGNRNKHNTISRKIRIKLSLFFIIAYVFTTSFFYIVQTQTVYNEVNNLLKVNINDIESDIKNVGDSYILDLTNKIKTDYEKNNNVSLEYLANKYNVTDIHIVDSNGIIIKSNGKEYIGFDMKSGKQSSEFMCLINEDETQFVQEYQLISFDNDDNLERKYAGVRLDSKSFIQVGLDNTNYQDYLTKSILGISYNRHIGENGYLIISDSNGKIISDTNSSYSTLEELGISLENKETLKRFIIEINDEKFFLMFDDVEGYKILLVYPQEEAFSTRDKMVYLNTYMEIIVFAVLFLLVYILIKRLVIDNIYRINRDLDSITGGNLETIVNVRKTDEFSNLSDGVNHTVDSLKVLIEKEKNKIEEELKFASNIQMSSLPRVFPISDSYNLFASMDTQKEVGGDFYDFYKLGQDKLAFMIADVSGKGIPAAMFMMKAKTIIKAHAEEGLTVDEIFTQSNKMLSDGNDQQMFVTGWMGILDIPTGHVTFCNAGHNPPIILRDGKYEYLKSKAGFVLAGFDSFKYKMQEFDLKTNDKIFLYTDGITEAINKDKELYGEKRLLNLFNNNLTKHPKEMLTLVKEELAAFTKEEEQFDDMTMLMLEYTGVNNSLTIKAEEKNLDIVNDFITDQLEKKDVNPSIQMKILVSIEEIFINICSHAYTKEKGDATIITNISNNVLTIKFIDTGIPFNPLLKEDPDVTLDGNDRPIGGLGIFMVKKQMDDVFYEYIDNKNILTIKKTIK